MKPAWAAEVGEDQYGQWADVRVDDLTVRMRWIEPGTFWMGSPASEAFREDDEAQYEVTLSHGYWLASTETSQALWQKIMGHNPSRLSGDISASRRYQGA